MFGHGLPESGRYVTFKQSVLATCARLPTVDSQWRWRGPGARCFAGTWEDVIVLKIEVVGTEGFNLHRYHEGSHLLRAGEAVIYVQLPSGRCVHFTGAQWQGMDVEPVKPHPVTAFRIFGTATGRLTSRQTSLVEVPRVVAAAAMPGQV